MNARAAVLLSLLSIAQQFLCLHRYTYTVYGVRQKVFFTVGALTLLIFLFSERPARLPCIGFGPVSEK
jgi:hypothetical protein